MGAACGPVGDGLGPAAEAEHEHGACSCHAVRWLWPVGGHQEVAASAEVGEWLVLDLGFGVFFPRHLISLRVTLDGEGKDEFNYHYYRYCWFLLRLNFQEVM